MSLAVVKQGPKTTQQLVQLGALARVAPRRVPRVLGSWRDGYAMEMLSPYPESSHCNWPVMADLSAWDFWCKEPLHEIADDLWRRNLRDTLGIDVPDWAWKDETPCATHGDLTLCNTMMRDGCLVFVDPVYPERVPQIMVADRARIVQTMLGWEIMTGFQREDDDFEWNMPIFVRSGGEHLRVLVFWVHVMMARIAASSAVTDSERAWAEHLRDETGRAVL